MPKGNLNFSDKETEKLFRDIHSQKIHLFNLPKNLYNATGEELTEGVFDGFGASPDINIQAPANDTIRQLKKSVYQFSAAKQFQFISDMQNFLFDEKGMIRPFKEFKVFADVINDQYNKNWLKAEYITSINMATGAADWERIEEEKEVFPFLKYETVGDPRVRNEHAAINGVVKRVDDPFWDTFMPPNGWRCRCDVVQRETGTETNLSKKKVPKLDPVFDGNSGKRKTVFNEKHPYNKVPKKFKKHQENNFGLPLPKDVKEPKNVGVDEIKKRALKIDAETLKEKGILTLMSPTAKKKAADLNKFHKADAQAVDDFVVKPKPKTAKTATTLDEAVKNEKEFIKTLTKEEKDLMSWWTTDEYTDINGYLRGRKGWEDLKDNKPFVKAVKDLTNVVNKSPKYKGLTNRGIYFDDEIKYKNFIKQFTEGGIYSDKGFMSASLKEVERFNYGGEFNVSMRIKGKSGVFIDDLTTGGFKIAEDAGNADLEILYKPKTSFKIDKITKDEFSDDRIIIELSEI